ncbi:MAG: hypothetical protein IBX63_04225 [Coriobacteriia bacterium]|nr:hypothetical protein [Coriobacteriia bacterium]
MSSRRRALFTRRALLVTNTVLAVLLLAGLIALVSYLSPGGAVVRGGKVASGLRPLLTVTGPGRGHYPVFVRPMSAAFGPDGRIHVLDTGNDRVVVLDRDGRYELEFGGFGAVKPLAGFEPSWSEGRMNHPLGIDVDEDGNIYVADLRNDQIQVFNQEGIFLRRFPDPVEVVGEGASGQGGTGIAVADVAVAGGLVFAVDTSQVVVFTTGGEFVRQFDRAASDAVEFDRISGVDATEDGRVYVVDSGNTRILALSAEGELVWSVGKSRDGDAGPPAVPPVSPYEFGLPRSIAVMADGTVAVLDALESSVVLFTRDGAFMGRYGVGGSNPAEFAGPSSIDARGDLLLVSDTGNHRIQVVEVVR